MSVQMPSPNLQPNRFRATFPLGGGLHDLGIDGMLVSIIGNVELHGGAGAVAIEHLVYAAFHIHHDRHFDHHQVEFLAAVVFDVALDMEDRLLRLLGSEQRVIVGGRILSNSL